MEELIIPLAGIFALFVVPALVGLTFIILWYKSRNRLYRSIDEAIDKNAPPEVINQLVTLTESKEKKDPKGSKVKRLTDAAFWVAIGVGFLFFFYFGGPRGVIFPGIFMTLYGLILLCIAIFAVKDDKTDSE